MIWFNYRSLGKIKHLAEMEKTKEMIYTIEITKVEEIGEQLIPRSKRKFIWKSEEHRTSMLGEPPNEDPLELYGYWTEVDIEPELVPKSYSLEAVCDEADYGDCILLPTREVDSMIYLVDKFVTQKRFIVGEPEFKVGDSVKCFLNAKFYKGA